MRLFCLMILLLCHTALPAEAKRVALVIGNDAYTNVTSLKKAANDANALALTLGDLGFNVMKEINASRRTMDNRLNELNSRIEAGDEVVVFFAGHGISVQGQNYLLPTDIPKIRPGQERSVTKEAFSENEIIKILQERGAKVSILIIDACRNNPFPKAGTRSLGRTVGLGQRTTPPRNTFIIYSAGIGQEALDRLSDSDLDPNSVFTRKLIPLLKTPGLSHVQMAKRLQVEVEQLALQAEQQHRQFPAFYDQVRGNFFFIPADQKAAPANVKVSESPEELLWNTIQNSTTAEDYQFYLRKFPKGRFVHIAELNLQKLSPKPVEKAKAPNETQKLALLKTPTTREIKLPELSADELTSDKGWIGVRIQDVTNETYESLGLEKKTGTLIVSISKDGPASNSDLKKGDVILEVSGQEMNSPQDVLKQIQAIGPGKKAHLKIMREKAPRHLTVGVTGFLAENRAAAKAGSLEALQNLATYYRFGQPQYRNLDKALIYLQLAADTGEKTALYDLAAFHDMDQGTIRKDRNKSFKYYKMAADKGHEFSRLKLGYAYRYGFGTEKNSALAFETFKSLANDGNASAMFNLGLMFESGESTSRDIEQALYWYRKASDKNDSTASLRLGVLFFEGKQVPKNMNAAENFLSKAKYPNAQGKLYLAMIYDKGEVRTKDPATAAKLVYETLKQRAVVGRDSLVNDPKSWSREFRKEIQTKLKADGHYTGNVDGDFGPGTLAAIKTLYEK